MPALPDSPDMHYIVKPYYFNDKETRFKRVMNSRRSEVSCKPGGRELDYAYMRIRKCPLALSNMTFIYHINSFQHHIVQRLPVTNDYIVKYCKIFIVMSHFEYVAPPCQLLYPQ